MKKTPRSYSVLTIISCIALLIAGIIRFYQGDMELFLIALLAAALIVGVRLCAFVPVVLRLGIVLFIIAAMLFGKVCNVYAVIFGYDKILHFLSGLLLALFGYFLFNRLGGNPKTHLRLALWFSFLFASGAAGVWEIYEFTVDALLGMHSQPDLTDTMWDIIMGNVSGLLGSLFLFIHINKRPFTLLMPLEQKNDHKNALKK